MNQTKDIYLNPEIKQYANSHPGLGLDGLASDITFFAESIIIGLIILAILWAGALKIFAGSSLTLTTSKNDIAKRAGISLIALIFVTSVFSMIKYSLNLGSSVGTAVIQAPPLQLPTQTKEVDGGGTPIAVSDTAKMLQEMIDTEPIKRNVVTTRGITINKGACTKIGQTGCTSLGGMSEATLALVTSIKTDCGCDIQITGGTEWWSHSSATKHKPGNSTAVDLHKTTALTDFIYSSSQFKKTTPWNSCYAAFSWNGFYFCDEKASGENPTHWHIQPL